MRLTKYEHACFTIELEGQLLVVDPGRLTTDFTPSDHISVVFISHEHSDHFDRNMLAMIADKNPHVVIVAHESVTLQLTTFATRQVNASDHIAIGPFNLEFFGGHHATIHQGMPGTANLGIMINSTVFYGGDSLTPPEKPVDTLAIPVTAPWLKIGEVLDYLTKVKPRTAFPTHDAIASDAGKTIVDRLVGSHAQAHGIEYVRMSASIDV